MQHSTCSADAIRRIVRVAEAHGVSPDRSLREARLEPRALRDPDARIGVRHLHALWRSVTRARPTICAEMARSMALDELGPFGFMIQTARDLARALEVSSAYFGVVNSDGTWRLEEDDELVHARWVRASPDSEGAARCDEAVVANFVSGFRQIALDPRVVCRVSLRHTLADRRALEETVGYRIEDDGPFTGFSVRRRALPTPTPYAHAAMHHHFEDAVRAQRDSAKHEASGLVEWARAEIERSLHQGAAQAAHLSRTLGIHERTLRRRLEAEGTSLRALVDEARRDEARRLLSESDRSITAIAHAIGFSETSAFSRAGRRWWGASPEHVRAEMRDARPHRSSSTYAGQVRGRA